MDYFTGLEKIKTIKTNSKIQLNDFVNCVKRLFFCGVHFNVNQTKEEKICFGLFVCDNLV